GRSALATATVTGRSLELDGLPAGSEVTVEPVGGIVRDEGPFASLVPPPKPPSDSPSGLAPGIPPTSFRTPRAVPVRNLAVWATDVAVLVDFDNPERAALELRVGPWGQNVPTRIVRVAAGSAVVRLTVEGLKARTVHFLRILPSGGWGGVEGLRFETMDRTQSGRIEFFKSEWLRDPDGFLITGGQFLSHPEPRFLPSLAKTLESPTRPLATRTREELVEALASARAPEIADHLERELASGRARPLELLYLRALAASRHRSVPRLARTLLADGPLGRDRVQTILAAVGLVPGPESFDLLLEMKARGGSAPWNGLDAALVNTDRARAASLARSILEGAPRPATQAEWLGVGIAELLGDRAAVEALTPYLDPRRAGRVLAAATQAVASIRLRESRDALLVALRRNPDETPLLYAAGEACLEEAIPILTERTAPVHARAQRGAAALALGLVGRGPPRPVSQCRAASRPGPRPDARVVEALVPMLDDETPKLRDAAAWALGLWPDPRGLVALRRFALSAADGTGRGAAALAELGDRQSVQPLADLAEKLMRSATDADRYRAGQVCLALARLGHRELRSGVAAFRQRVKGTNALVEALAKEALAMMTGATNDADHWIDPMTPLDRTAILMDAGDSLVVKLSGAMGFEDRIAEPSPVSLIAGYSRCPEPDPEPRVRGTVQRLAPDRFRVVAEDRCELVFTTQLAPRWNRPGARPDCVVPVCVGFTRVDLER
ncbi:MAG: hypothetical protein HY815_04580, partial [Candidatus Riflebacteria bacterium]|nr:hypothetical protein [Candidatus Riflebacteria bacterium]